ncbi:MAG: cell filamentation protein Fic [Bacteroidetes bacterium RIFOXYA12_FULL_35_11]|nr:MAG: cell filamentation protein Fic [Bacteroidetes bacterium GWF2_35_48]OFY76323.1 MAG: cell filamentation protein Fic [Bacteroidetes bacterium RIFOXYA12_FULL_35_11]OFY97576.1 MAG: cell filamentation protein Fic [Bacteroidetes bacterium RIFOXYB2_FULL_35_7]OFZ04630.1 MAG: cell filamentation protein Fic [Bacteroidetes bacterium RIFOXYC12_FULL_35_7]
MTKSTHFSQSALVFQGKQLPEEATVVGYGAIIQSLQLEIPLPATIAVVSKQNKKYQQENWMVFPKSYLPEDSKKLSEIEALHKQLVFALKYEGINLLLFKKITTHYTLKQLNELVAIEPTGQYTRRIWFLIEWLSGTKLKSKKDLLKKSYVKLIDESLQFAVEGVKSPRHLVINNLPGTIDFCPLVSKTSKLEKYIEENLATKQEIFLQGIRKDILQRASAFLLLKDSKASFSIEGENPKSKRAARWGQAIGQAGMKDLSHNELFRLQQLVIENPRFIQMEYRKKGGFVGEHDRNTGEPIPAHISAKWQDIVKLMNGFLETYQLILKNNTDAVISAATIAFGFVFIHPFEDGNGRIHRYLIHHILIKKKFSQQGIIFPVSAAMLDKINEYREVLESYATPLLDFIQWKETKDHNVEITNDTIDFYRYFDATKQAEFLYDCVKETIAHIIPKEVEYLIQYDTFKNFIEDEYEMPDKLIALLARFLEQNNGLLSRRAREKEFESLNDNEIRTIEKAYREIFMNNKQ